LGPAIGTLAGGEKNKRTEKQEVRSHPTASKILKH